MWNSIITLKNGIKVKVWSDNEDCTLHVYDARTFFDPEWTCCTLVNYSEVIQEDLNNLCFYKKNIDD